MKQWGFGIVMFCLVMILFFTMKGSPPERESNFRPPREGDNRDLKALEDKISDLSIALDNVHSRKVVAR
jgi:hypothetical protein